LDHDRIRSIVVVVIVVLAIRAAVHLHNFHVSLGFIVPVHVRAHLTLDQVVLAVRVLVIVRVLSEVLNQR
jgi:hypothetical protein